MRQIAKPILLTSVILLGFFLVPCLLINAWLLIPGNRQKLISLAEEEGLPHLTVEGVHAVPFATITFSGISNPPGSVPMIASAESLTVTPRFFDLIGGRLSLGSIKAQKPLLKVTLPPQSSNTGFSSVQSGNLSSLPKVNQANTPTVPNQAPNGFHATLSATENPRMSTTRVAVRHGEFVLLDAQSKAILSIQDVGVVDRGSSLMRFTAGKALVGQTLEFTELQGDLSIGSHLAVRDLKAGFAGGLLAGSMDCTMPLSSSSRYHVDLRLSGANPAALISASALNTQETLGSKGSLSGTLVLEGVPGNGTTMNGHGELMCRESVIRPVDFLQQVGKILNIDELQILKLTEGRCLFRIQAGNFLINQLVLRSENLCLTAKGPVAPTGELALDARILFNEKLTRRLGGILGKQLQQAPEAGYTQIPFTVSGTLRNPRTDLLERLTGIRIGGDLGGLIQGLFGRPSPKQTP